MENQELLALRWIFVILQLPKELFLVTNGFSLVPVCSTYWLKVDVEVVPRVTNSVDSQRKEMWDLVQY